MTGPGRPIAEEDLHAYVDGLLDAERRAAVERYLQANAEAAERVAIYVAQRQELRAVLSVRAWDPIPPNLNLARLLEESLRRRRRPWRAAAAILLAAGLGAGAGWIVGQRPATGIRAIAQEGATSYAVYAADKRRPVEVWATQKDDLSRWLTNRLNRPVSPPDLSSLQYQLLGGRLVATSHGPAALFMYENPRGVRLAIYVRPMSVGETTPIKATDVNDVDGCTWIERGIGYSL
ncbi:MAG TPA: anti-sigma factor, partial [Acetobacteraceae bacterium]|nr:anti-sigma factor [Acetobacteraceae bacterium]